MNVIERQTELTKSLYSINTTALKEFASQQKANVERYIELNKSFGEKLPEVKDIPGFFTLQREYGETLWTNTKAAFETQSELVKTTFEETRDAFKVALTAEASSEEKTVEAAAPVKTVAKKAKAKPRAKKAAE